jgi:hypothetical protein
MKKFTLKSGNTTPFKQMGSSPVKQKVDPDAPGTPGTPGYEPPVRREDLDEKGKAIWDAHRAKKRKEALLDKGFTQEDADWMIKHGGDIGPTPAPEHPKYEKKAKKKSPLETEGHGGKKGHTHPKVMKSMSKKDIQDAGLRSAKKGWSWVTLDGKPSEVKN